MKRLYVEKCLKINPQNFNLRIFFCYLPTVISDNYREVAEWLKAHAWKACMR